MTTGATISQRSKALAKIVRLARENDLSAAEIKDALERPLQDQYPKQQFSTAFLTGLLGYLGGALIVSGLFIFASIIWEDISSFPRVLLSLGSGLLAFILGVHLQKREETHKASLPLWILSAMLIPTGLFVALNEYAKGDDFILGAAIVFGVTALTYGIGFVQFKRTSLLLFTLAFGLAFTGTLYDHLSINVPEMWLVTSVAMSAIAGRVFYSSHRAISFFPVIAAIIMLTSSGYYFFGNTELEGLMTALILACIFTGYKIGSRSLITASGVIFFMQFCKHYTYCAGYLNDPMFKLTAAATGVSMMLVAEWLKDNTVSQLTPLWHFFGSCLMFSAFMGLWYETPYDILFPALPALVLYISLRLHSRALLLSSILALLSFISYYSAIYFADMLGWPIALMLTGFILIGLCSFALKMNARLKTQ